MTPSPSQLPLLCLLVAFAASAVNGQTPPNPEAAKNDAAIAKGVAYLLSKQNSDGSIHETPKNETAMTSLAVMAMSAVGHLPSDSTPEGIAMKRALSYVLRDDRQTAAGYFGQADGSRMYGHGITTLMLTEMLGMGRDAQQDELIHTHCQKGIDLIVRSQRVKKREPILEGGWRYLPDDGDSDVSVTAWQVLALRSAKNAGLDVPDGTIEAALAFVKRMFEAEQVPHPGFTYRHTELPYLSMTCAGLLTMQICGQGSSPECVQAVPWLYALPDGGQRFFYYSCYYQTQALHQHGTENDARMLRLVDGVLRGQQTPTGVFVSIPGSEREATGVYTTSMAILSLSVNHHYLPIYQK